MRSAISVAALLAFAGAALAQTADFDPLSKPTKGAQIPAGSTYEVVWEALDKYNGTASIFLLAGSSPTTLELGDAIATSIDNSAGKYEWTVDSSLGADSTYGLKIQYDSDTTIFQYSFPFAIVGASGSASGSASVTSTTKTASASETASVTTITTASSGSSESAAGTTTSSAGPAQTTTSSAGSVETTTGSSGNLSTTGTVQTITSVVVPSSSGSSGSSSSSTTASPSSVVSSGASSMAAGSFAILGGLAAAVLAL